MKALQVDPGVLTSGESKGKKLQRLLISLVSHAFCIY